MPTRFVNPRSNWQINAETQAHMHKPQADS